MPEITLLKVCHSKIFYLLPVILLFQILIVKTDLSRNFMVHGMGSEFKFIYF